VPPLREKHNELIAAAEAKYAEYQKFCPEKAPPKEDGPKPVGEAASTDTAANNLLVALDCLTACLQSDQTILDGCFGNVESGARDLLTDLFSRMRVAVQHVQVQKEKGPHQLDFGDLVPFTVAAQIQADEGAAIAEQVARDMNEALAADTALDSTTKEAFEKMRGVQATAMRKSLAGGVQKLMKQKGRAAAKGEKKLF